MEARCRFSAFGLMTILLLAACSTPVERDRRAFADQVFAYEAQCATRANKQDEWMSVPATALALSPPNRISGVLALTSVQEGAYVTPAVEIIASEVRGRSFTEIGLHRCQKNADCTSATQIWPSGGDTVSLHLGPAIAAGSPTPFEIEFRTLRRWAVTIADQHVVLDFPYDVSDLTFRCVSGGGWIKIDDPKNMSK